MVRKAIEKLYIGTCIITEYQEIRDEETKITKHEPVDVLIDQPCRLSFKNIANASSTDTGSSVSQIVKLFIAPEIVIKPGSKITVTQNGITTAYKNSGEPAIFKSHQEVILELFKGWS